MPPLREFQVTRRNLPHWQRPGAAYFLTWRTADGIELAAEDRALALNAIRFWDGRRWFVFAAVIMPDHAHALVRPLPVDDAASEFVSLADLTKSVKGYSAREINRRRGRTGPIWQDEGYDRIVRDERELEETWGYIAFNPVKTGLAEAPERYPWFYQAGRAD